MGLSDVGINSWSTEYEKIQEVDLSIFCDTNEALPELIRRGKEKLSGNEAKQEEIGRRFKTLGTEHAKVREQWQADAHENWDLTPISITRRLILQDWHDLFGWYAQGPIANGSDVRDAVKKAIQFINKEKNRPWSIRLFNIFNIYDIPDQLLSDIRRSDKIIQKFHLDRRNYYT